MMAMSSCTLRRHHPRAMLYAADQTHSLVTMFLVIPFQHLEERLKPSGKTWRQFR